MMTLRVQVMWSSQSFRIASCRASADREIGARFVTGACLARALPLAGEAPVTASTPASATIATDAETAHLERDGRAW